MKRMHYMAAGMAVFFFVYCKSTKTPATTATPPVTPAPAVATATPAVNSPGAVQMQIAEKRWPGTVADELKEGQAIYTTRCTRCHKAFTIEEFGEKKWLHEIDDMSPKARLTPEEKLKLTKYILSYRETKETLKGN